MRLTRLLTTANKGTRILQDLHNTYDPVGNITRQLDDAQKTIFYGGQKVNAQSNYLYDSLYRLIEAEGREHTGQAGTNLQDNWDGQLEHAHASAKLTGSITWLHAKIWL